VHLARWPLLVLVKHLVAVQTAEVRAHKGTPFAGTFLTINLVGITPECYVPVLETTAALPSPILLSPQLASRAGTNR
jgi:hypothetical protein